MVKKLLGGFLGNEGVKDATRLPETAWPPTTQPSSRHAVVVFMETRRRTLDTAPPGPGTHVAGLRFAGSTLIWTHDGVPRSAGLS
jgi:hypothetical protein